MTVALVANIARPISSAISTAFSADSYGALSSYGLIGGSTNPDAVIEALFASGEQGAWYDPSDLSTMFQDSAGTTPVTADGQPVGLILDKSKELALQELVVNGSFDSGASWTLVGGVISGGNLTFSASAANDYASNTSTNPAAGDILEFTVTITAMSAGSIRPQCGGSVGTSRTSVGTYTERVRSAGAGAAAIVATAAGTTATISEFSVKRISGNHASQDTAAKRPLYKTSGLAKYNDYDVVDDVLNTTFPSSLGSSCTVAKAVVGGSPTILTGQTIGTTWAESTDNAGVVIVNRALTTQETTDLTAWLTAKVATA